MNIVFGGSFNPVTKAHKKIIEDLIKLYNPINFIVVPVGNVYKKDGLLDFNYRFDMLNIALSDLDVLISKLESKENKFLGTYQLLKELNEDYNDLYFVMGADNLINIENWIESDKLLSQYKFIIINRNKFDVKSFIKDKLKDYLDNFLIYDINIEVSSSIIRKNIEEQKDKLDNKVYEYILENNLYQKEK